MPDPGVPGELDPDRYEPMPVPLAPRGADRDPTPAGEPISYDLRTGDEVRGSRAARDRLDAAAELVPGSGGAVTGQSEADLMLQENFNSHRLVGSYDRFPWRMNVKVFLTFPNNKSFVCSGALSDPLHVLTAGHCVHSKQNGGWAKSVRIVPAYNGQKSGSDREPYGDANAVQLHSWTGWTNNQSFRHDVAVIDLDRPVGAITGWFGYGRNNSCGWFTSTTWHHASYPAESPFNGQRMYYQFGDFDSCPGLVPPLEQYEARYKRKAFGGESGSGFYKITNGSRVVYATLSHRNSNGTSDAVRLQGSKFSDVTSFLVADRPTSFDFTPLHVQGSSKVSRGDRIDELQFLLHNDSRAKFSGTVRFTVRLSTNRLITTADRSLGAFSVRLSSVDPLGSVTVKWASGNGPRVPSTVAVRDYFIGIILTTPEAKSSNQRTMADDVLPIRVFQNGAFTGLRSGCSGTNGRLVHTASGQPMIGNRVSYLLRNAAPRAGAWLAIGASRTRWGSGSLPFDLGVIGAPGCFARVSQDVILPTRTTTAGSAARSLSLPSSTSLVGARFYTQYLAADGRANRLGLTTSNGVQTLVGRD